MSITFLAETWISGKNTMVVTIPMVLRKNRKIQKGQMVQVTIHDGHKEFVCNHMDSKDVSSSKLENEIKCEKQGGITNE